MDWVQWQLASRSSRRPTPPPPEQAGLAGAVGPRDQQVGARGHTQRQVVHKRGIAGGNHHSVLKHNGVVAGQQLPRGRRQLACSSWLGGWVDAWAAGLRACRLV